MSPQQFDEILNLVKPLIAKKNTRFRKSIAADVRLAVTLRFMACGTSQYDLSYHFQIGRTTLSTIIRECADAIFQVLGEKVLRAPQTPAEWLEIADGFELKWQFPHCVGAIDGKHIKVRCPAKSGSQYFNYKGYYSFVLMAACDSNYCFTLIDVGNYGRISDGGVFANSWFGKKCLDDSFNFPPHSSILENTPKLPYVFVGDEAFPLTVRIMRPFPGLNLTLQQKIYNYRLSRARRVIENAFGILVTRWRLLLRPIDLNVDTAIVVTKAILCLHNYLKKSQHQPTSVSYCSSNYVDSENADGIVTPGQWRVIALNEASGIITLRRTRASRFTETAKTTRDLFTHYFNSRRGSIPWQTNCVTRTA